jgi:hypothetical protein
MRREESTEGIRSSFGLRSAKCSLVFSLCCLVSASSFLALVAVVPFAVSSREWERKGGCCVGVHPSSPISTNTVLCGTGMVRSPGYLRPAAGISRPHPGSHHVAIAAPVATAIYADEQKGPSCGAFLFGNGCRVFQYSSCSTVRDFYNCNSQTLFLCFDWPFVAVQSFDLVLEYNCTWGWFLLMGSRQFLQASSIWSSRKLHRLPHPVLYTAHHSQILICCGNQFSHRFIMVIRDCAPYIRIFLSHVNVTATRWPFQKKKLLLGDCGWSSLRSNAVDQTTNERQHAMQPLHATTTPPSIYSSTSDYHL